ncbi:unnamed protein product [Durusdinium trenchii]|uniref:Uncharacterized protein n=2 Tax=Durusdinium trenchii TaxID=1381693 RepID=A0ABP0PN16_9DINO
MCSEAEPGDKWFQGARQAGQGPEHWGISLEQLESLEKQTGKAMTMREVVESQIKPMTKTTGLGYALKLNLQRPLVAKVMVSHAWDEIYVHLVAALKCFIRISSQNHHCAVGTEGYWVCATAIYQPEDVEELTIAKQLGPDPNHGPFAAVLRQASAMVACITEACDIYSRMWCVFEIFMAKELGVQVYMANGAEEEEHTGTTVSLSRLIDPMVDAFGEQCLKPANSLAARCGKPSLQMNKDEEMIREAIQRCPGQFDAVDHAVEESRLDALRRFLEEERAKYNSFQECKPMLLHFYCSKTEELEATERHFAKVFNLYNEVMHSVEERLLCLRQQLEKRGSKHVGVTSKNRCG